MKKTTIFLLSLLMWAFVAQVNAATIIRNDVGPTSSYYFGAFGQSFVTPDGPAYNTITFSWLGIGSSPAASGTLYLLNQEWIGLPEHLSSSTLGYIAQSTSIVGNAYIFDPSVELSANTKYWVYMGGPAQYVGTYASEPVFNWSFYTPAGLPYIRDDYRAANFLLTGNAVIPEPSVMMLCAGAGILGFFRFRRRPRQ